MHTVKLRKIGNSVGVTFPKEVLEQMNVQEGDELYLTQHQNSLHLTAGNPDFERQMERYRSIKSRYQNAFKELAK